MITTCPAYPATPTDRSDPAVNELHRAFAARVRAMVRRAGGTRRIARLTGLSEAQLYRYFKGAPMPSNRVIALALACGQSPASLFIMAQEDPGP